ncbi:hypothetical protein GCM10009835_33510 [Planosporangium flavigriseum]|uniref:Uncharacterized protein n=1 Tax=Planosporangium flavigriseum TaxID=373681 RepID=A0A8J3PLL4_9ACTN|nr:hypothetical protein Pfl04_30300 [Planosporangium flavigriseum]
MQRTASGRMPLPLPPNTAVCLTCAWLTVSDDDVRADAQAHTSETRHPTIAAIPDPVVRPVLSALGTASRRT